MRRSPSRMPPAAKRTDAGWGTGIGMRDGSGVTDLTHTAGFTHHKHANRHQQHAEQYHQHMRVHHQGCARPQHVADRRHHAEHQTVSPTHMPFAGARHQRYHRGQSDDHQGAGRRGMRLPVPADTPAPARIECRRRRLAPPRRCRHRSRLSMPERDEPSIPTFRGIKRHVQ